MKIKLIDYGGKMPVRMHYNDAGADVYSPGVYILHPQQIVTIPLGFGLEIPDGLVGFIFPRSSLSKKGIICELPPIDSGYQGEAHAIIANVSCNTYNIQKGERIGQLLILPIVIAEFVTDLGAEREIGAFGSSGR